MSLCLKIYKTKMSEYIKLKLIFQKKIASIHKNVSSLNKKHH